MVEAQRGVSWIYILADGVTDKACIVEAGFKTDSLNFFKYPPKHLKNILPNKDFLKNHSSTEFRKGLMVRWQEYQTEDADLLLIAYGTVGRIGTSALREARKIGMKVGMLRPTTLWPLAEERIDALTEQVRGILVAEMSAGQLVEDVRRVVARRKPVQFHGRLGGVVPMADEILDALRDLDEETH
jgi:2-oxoglutarate ferredoxin oxidoreductase subunit alpha